MAASTSTAVTVLDLLQRVQAALREPTETLDEVLTLCKQRVDECVSVLEGTVSSDGLLAHDSSSSGAATR